MGTATKRGVDSVDELPVAPDVITLRDPPTYRASASIWQPWQNQFTGFSSSPPAMPSSSRFRWAFALLLLSLCIAVSGAWAYKLPDLYEASIAELQAGLDAHKFTSVDLVKVCCSL